MNKSFNGIKQSLIRYPFSIAIVIVIIVLSFFSPPETGLDSVKHIDKLAHICMYGGLEIMLWLEYLKHHRSLNLNKIILLAIIVPIIFGGLIELGQMILTENRSAEFADFVSDFVGVISGALLGCFVIKPIVWKR